MLSLLLLLPLAVCNSTFTCSVACEKDDVAACTWLAHELNDRHAAARACALDDTACDELARILIEHGRRQDLDDAVARLAPRCERGDMASCAVILNAAWDRENTTSTPLALSTRAASRAYCTTAVPEACSGDECRGWWRLVDVCTSAAAGLNEPRLADSVWSRAMAACRTDANACSQLLFAAIDRMQGAKTPQERSQQTKLFAEVVNTALPACKKPRSDACQLLSHLNLEEFPSLATAVSSRLCTVEGGRRCSEQLVRRCDGGKGPLASCIDVVLALGPGNFNDEAAVSKKLIEACIKDDAWACFAHGLATVEPRYRSGSQVLTADEAFAKACKLKHKAACRATTTTEKILRPNAVPKDAIHPSETISVQVRARGNGAAIGKVFLVDEWTWFGDDEAMHQRSVVVDEDRIELGGLNEGADVIVWKENTDSVTRTVVLTNVGR